jgi:hypothetical protein
MTLRGEVMVVADSTFAGLQSFGDAAIVFAASNVTFINTTFVTSNNSAGETPTPRTHVASITYCPFAMTADIGHIYEAGLGWSGALHWAQRFTFPHGRQAGEIRMAELEKSDSI